MFAELGCEVVDGEPDLAGVDELFQTLRAAGYAAAHGRRSGTHRAQLKDTVIWNIEQGIETDAGRPRARREDSSRARRPRRASSSRAHEFLVLPTVQVLPFPIEDRVGASDRRRRDAAPTSTGWRAAMRSAASGAPAISVPCGFSPDGLPVGLQIVGRPRRDLEVLAARARVRAGDALCSASPATRRASVGRSCAPTICRRKRSATIFTSGSKASRKYFLPVCKRPLAVAEHGEVLVIGELVAADEVETFTVADEVEQVAGTNLRRRGEEIGAVLGERSGARIAHAVKQGQRLVAGATRDPAETQIVDDRRAVHLLDGDAPQPEHLRVAVTRARHVTHFDLVASLPLRVTRFAGKKLRANTLRYLVAVARVLPDSLLGLEHQASGSDV